MNYSTSICVFVANTSLKRNYLISDRVHVDSSQGRRNSDAAWLTPAQIVLQIT